MPYRLPSPQGWRRALKRSSADIAVAISGVAGPDGGTPQKPVGTVVFAVAERGKDPEDVVADKIHFGEDKNRSEIRKAATLHALQLLLPTCKAHQPVR